LFSPILGFSLGKEHMKTIKVLFLLNELFISSVSFGIEAEANSEELRLLEAIKAVVVQRADVNEFSTDGQTPLNWASREGYTEIVKFFLANGVEVNLADADGETPLICSSYQGYAKIVKLLLDNDAKVNQADTTDGETPLFTASQEGHFDVVKLLLEAGADVNKENEDGETPLFIASQEGHFDVIKLLLEAGADVNLTDKRGRSPFVVAKNDEIKGLLAGVGPARERRILFLKKLDNPRAFQRQWLRVLAFANPILFARVQARNPEVSALVNFFTKFPGLKRQIAGIMVGYVNPLTSETFEEAKRKK